MIIVFSSTINPEDIANYDNFYLYPPIEQGQLIDIVEKKEPDAIIISDTVFNTRMPVWHKELIYALKKGIHVYGVGGLGVSRALELVPYGMKGFGRIYEMYAREEVTSDDELLTYIHEDGLQTVPLVNIRLTLKEGIDKGIISKTDYNLLIDKIIDIYYQDRTWGNIEKAVFSCFKDKNIYTWLKDHYRNYQKEDILQLLSDLNFSPPKRTVLKFNGFNKIGEQFYNNDRKVSQDGCSFAQNKIAYTFELLHPDAEEQIWIAFAKNVLLNFVKEQMIVVPEQEIEAEKTAIFKKLKLEPQKIDEWLKNNDLTIEAFSEIIMNEAILKRLQKNFLISPLGRSRLIKKILDQLKLKGCYGEWKGKAAARALVIDNDKNRDLITEAFNKNLIDCITDFISVAPNNKNYLYIDSVYLGTMMPGVLKLHLALEKVYRGKIAQMAENMF